MRAFLAVKTGSHLSAKLSSRLDPLVEPLGDVQALRWTLPRSWHMTLQFLGDWPESRLEQLQEAIGSMSLPPGFALQPSGMGAFPHLRKPRVLFLQLGGNGQAELLASSLRQTVEDVWCEGPQDRKHFRPHLTLARVKGRLTSEVIDSVGRWDLSGLPPWPVDSFQLVISRVKAEGAEHRVLGTYSLPEDP